MTASRLQILLARLAGLLLIGLIIVGVIRHGISIPVLRRIWQNLMQRPGDLMTFRFILQPAMAVIAAFYDGRKDARLGRSPYLWTVLTRTTKRAGRLQEGLIATARIILLGLLMDTIYQVIVLQTFFPAEAVIVAVLLAFLPYLILRGPIARIIYWFRGKSPADLN